MEYKFLGIVSCKIQKLCWKISELQTIQPKILPILGGKSTGKKIPGQTFSNICCVLYVVVIFFENTIYSTLHWKFSETQTWIFDHMGSVHVSEIGVCSFGLNAALQLSLHTQMAWQLRWHTRIFCLNNKTWKHYETMLNRKFEEEMLWCKLLHIKNFSCIKLLRELYYSVDFSRPLLI